MSRTVALPAKARPGDIAVLSPSFGAPGIAAAVHEQAMRRLDVGKDRADPQALSEYGDREPTQPWGPAPPAP